MIKLNLNTTWSAEEDAKLMLYGKAIPNCWKTISAIVGRKGEDCFARFKQLSNHNLTRRIGKANIYSHSSKHVSIDVKKLIVNDPASDDEILRMTTIFNKTECLYNVDMPGRLIPKLVKDSKEQCNCVVEDGNLCNDDCYHRHQEMECYKSCVLYQNGTTIKCSNQQARSNPGGTGLELFQTLTLGLGVRTTVEIANGSYVISYIGEVIPEDLYKDRVKNLGHSYGIKINGLPLVLDASFYGNLSRYINASHIPNLELTWRYIDLMPVPVLTAIRKIYKGEQLFYDYNFQNYSSAFQCSCPAQKCIASRQIEPVRLSNDVVKAIPCILCKNKYFETPLNLQLHHKQVHRITWKATDVQLLSLQCDTCGAVFQKRSKFLDHLSTHITIKTENCPYCVKVYKSSKNLKEHIKKIHFA